jgi:hypothetical protein
MKKYAIVEKRSPKNKLYWESHLYNWYFRLWGATYQTQIDCTFESAGACEIELINRLNNKGKYKIIQIFEA